MLSAVPSHASAAGPNGINIGFNFNWNLNGPAGYSASFLATTSNTGSTLDNCLGPVTTSTHACNFVFSYDIGGVAQSAVTTGGVYDTWPTTLTGQLCNENPNDSAPLTLFSCFNQNSFGQIFLAGSTGTLSNFSMSMTCLNPAGTPITGAMALLYQINSGGASIPATPIAQAPLDLSSCPTLTSWSGHTFSATDFASIPMNFANVTLTSGNFYGVYFAYPLRWLTVTTMADQTDTGATCTGTTTCSLRDAISLVDAENAGAITGVKFQSGLTGTINLQSGLTVTGNTLIQGPGANLVTVSGAGASNPFTVFTINNGVGMVGVSGLTISNGNSTSGGGISNASSILTVTDSAFSQNISTGQGGAISNDGTLTVANSTFSNNSAGTEGGAIYNDGGALQVTNSTFSTNVSTAEGGAIYNVNGVPSMTGDTVSGNSASDGGGVFNNVAGFVLANSIVSGNTANSTANDIDGGAYTDQGGNFVGYANGATVNAGAVNLSQLGSNGGPTQTLVPLPGSPALCAGVSANIPLGNNNDQRGTGYSRTNPTYTGYSNSSPCVDSGAVQTQYALAFTTQPVNVSETAVMTAPAVTLTENGVAAAFASSGALTVTDSDSYLSSNSTSTITLASGVATLSNLIFTTPTSSDSLTASIQLLPTVTLTANSSAFEVNTASSTSTSVTLNPATAVYGQPTSIAVQVTDTASGQSTQIPTGSVTLTDSVSSTVTPLNGGNSITLANGSAGLGSIVLNGVGTHTVQASYTGASQSGYLASTGVSTVAVNQATPIMTAPTAQPVTIVAGQSGTISVNVAGPYSGAGISSPSGSVSYSIVNASGSTITSGTAALSSGAASIPVASTLASGNYTVQIAYAGDTNYAAAASIAVNLQVSQSQASINWATPSAIVYGTNLSGILNAQAMNGSAVLQGTATYTATPANGSATSVTAASILPAGTYTLNATVTPASSAFKSVSGSVSLSVTQAGSSVALQSSANPVLTENAVTLTATVSSSVSTPTGTVTFYNGTAAVGSAASLNTSGVATLTTTSLPVGSDSITAVYSGDTNLAASTSSAISETIQDFNLTLSTTSGSSTTVTVSAGQAAVYNLNVSPQGSGATFPGPVSLSISGLPSGATATFSPSTLPAGSVGTPVTLTIQLPSQTAANKAPSGLPRCGIPVALGMLLLPFAAGIRRSSQKLRQGTMIVLVGIALIGSIFGLTGCGSKSSGFAGQTAHTYNLTVTATSGSLSHSTTITLNVE